MIDIILVGAVLPLVLGMLTATIIILLTDKVD